MRLHVRWHMDDMFIQYCIDIDALYVIKVVSNKYFIGSKSLGKRLQWMDSYRTFFPPQRSNNRMLQSHGV